MAREDQTYITIISWPDGYTAANQLEAVVAATGLEPVQAARRVMRGVPAVIQRVPTSLVDNVTTPLRTRGVGFVTMAERRLRALPKPILLKRLTSADGAPQPMFLAEPWRGDPFGLRAADLFLLLRARLRKTLAREPEHDVTYYPYSIFGSRAPTPFPGHIAVENIARGVRVTEVISRDLNDTIDVIDLCTHNDTRYRIRGDKFNFDVLGNARGHSDFENADKLAYLLAQAAPTCVIDTTFPLFRCPEEFAHDWRTANRKPSETRNDEPAFEFYSAWSVLYHHARVR